MKERPDIDINTLNRRLEQEALKKRGLIRVEGYPEPRGLSSFEGRLQELIDWCELAVENRRKLAGEPMIGYQRAELTFNTGEQLLEVLKQYALRDRMIEAVSRIPGDRC